MKKSGKDITRRDFIGKSALAAGAFTIIPRHVMGKGFTAPSDRLNVAGIGIGGAGGGNIRRFSREENIVALCDVDWKYAQPVFDEHKKARKFRDYRKMFDAMADEIDAVVVGTPDHTHAIVSSHAMKLGKHVFVQKPLTHTVYESRYLTRLAEKTGVVTQMGNQGNSGEGIRKICEWIWDGAIGEVKEVHCWTNRPIWPQGLERPADKMVVPETLDWDLFLGPARWRPYHSAYTPWNWRAFWDFGTGALGDMACHIIDPAFKALKLKYPYAVEASSTDVNTESAPVAEKVTYYFPERDGLEKVKMPAVKLIWYDGGLMPERPAELADNEMMGDWGGGTLFVGSKGKIICETYAKNPKLLGVDNYEAPKVLRRVKNGSEGHEADFARACKESPESRIMPSSGFDYAGPFNETVVMGNLAVRLQGLRRVLQWDGENMEITNIGENEKIGILTKKNFHIHDGHPSFDNKYDEFNAKELAGEIIKHDYRKGWEL